MLDKVKEFVCDAADKAVNAPPCLINNFVGNMLGSQSDGIQNSINGQLGQLNSLIGGLGGNIGGGIGGIGGGLGAGGGGGFLEEIMSFLKCDDDIDCSEVDEWSILDGADQSEKFDVGGLLSAVGSFAGGGGGGQGGGSSSGSGGSGGDLGFGNVNIGNSFQPGCNTGPIPCGPPTPKFFGAGRS